MVLLLVFMQLTRDLFAIAKFLLIIIITQERVVLGCSKIGAGFGYVTGDTGRAFKVKVQGHKVT